MSSGSSSSSTCSAVTGGFEAISTEINHGVDPITGVGKIWACLQVGIDAAGRNNVAVKLVLTSGTPKCVTLEVADPTKASASLGAWSGSQATVTIEGLASTENTTSGPTGVEVRAKNAAEVVARFQVMVLPFVSRTFSSYAVSDPRRPSGCTSGFTPPTGTAVGTVLNDVYNRQGCIGFTLHEEAAKSLDYDDNDDCALSVNKDYDGQDETVAFSSPGWTGADYYAAWVKKSAMYQSLGCPSYSSNNPPARGIQAGSSSTKIGVVAIQDAGSEASLGIAHEFGHWFGMDHYAGSFPSGTLPLMRSGYTDQCQYQDIGYWLTKDEWYQIYKANNQ